MPRILLGLAFLLSFGASRVSAQVTLAAKDAVFKSVGSVSGSGWNLTSNGYLGTFLHLDRPASVQITLQAQGSQAGGGWPLMDLHVGDRKASWSVNSTSWADYTATFQLPAGTHLVRTEFLNDYYAAPNDRNLMIGSVSLASPDGGVSFDNTTGAVMKAADSYIESFRKGDAQVTLHRADGSPLPAGTSVQVKLRRHAFHFGTAVAGSSLTASNNYLIANPSPGSNADKYQQALKQHFNILVPENAGKWPNNEATRGKVDLGLVDRICDFATANGMDVRMHNVVWDQGTTPTWMYNLRTAAAGGDAAAKADLRGAISTRIDYYVHDRAPRYLAIDGINESSHKHAFTDIYGMAGIAGMYNEMIDATRAAGSDASVFFNEYNVLNNGADSWGNWYRSHIQSVIDAGIGPENRQRLGVGIQYYTSPSSHNTTTIYKTLQNLAGLEYPMTLTEFGVQDANAADAPQILADTMRLVFGSDQTDGFLMWGFWKTAMWMNGAALFDENWNLTPTGQVYEQLLGIHDWGLPNVPSWTTDLTLTTDANGQIDFRGFYGQYDLLVDGQSYALDLQRGVSTYSLAIPEPGALALAVAGALWLGVQQGCRWRRAGSHPGSRADDAGP